MKSEKSNINILGFFMILAIVGLIIYIIIDNRNKKSNPKTNIPNATPYKPERWDMIIFVAKDPDTISVGFSPTRDVRGNIDLVDSKNNLTYSEMEDPITDGEQIMNFYNINKEPIVSYLNKYGITETEFSSNKSVIAIYNKVLGNNFILGNIPYPGKDLIIYVLNKKTGIMNSYNLSRSVTYTYQAGPVILKPMITHTEFNFNIQNSDPQKNIPALVIINI